MGAQLPATFDPRAVGFIEARLWHAYYARHWPRVALLTYRLVRGQLGLAPRSALEAVGHAARAAIAWAPAKNDPDATRRELRAFYRLVAREQDASFDPDAVGDAEFDYWQIHRAIVGQTDRAPLIASLARIPALLYAVPEAGLLPSATERERAVRLVDLITSGQRQPTDAAWDEIAVSLVRSCQLLRAEIAAGRASPS
ncbi:MAG: hypothetical protein QOJ59_3675 [Thermomicrobiales bacterium]|jgi:hypothetical protein|nr:hypothetical protein [Thermomicrobiales bacterium]